MSGSGSLLVHFQVSPLVASKVALPGGEAPESLHLTLAYIGRLENLPDDAPDRVRQAVQQVGQEFGPVDGVIGGHGRFNASDTSDGLDVYYASYDSPLLPALRQALVEAIEATGLAVKSEHGYTPHITLKYLSPDEPMPEQRNETVPARFEAVTVTAGRLGEPGTSNLDVTLRGDRILKEVSEDERGALIMLGFGKKKPKRQTVEISDDVAGALRMLGVPALGSKPSSPVVRILKSGPDDEKRLVYGVVLQPMMIDLDGNIMTAEDVEFAAHHFLAVGGAMADRHARFTDAVPVESYIAPCDFDMGGQKVLAGSWVVVSYVRSDEVWSKVKSGEYTGYSVGGFGKLTEL